MSPRSLAPLAALALLSLAALVGARTRIGRVDEYHPSPLLNVAKVNNLNEEELIGDYWVSKAQDALRARSAGPMNENVAKNVIMFLGDGMSVPTLAAARTLLGQREGRPGEEAKLSFEEFPVVGLAKTYCVDSQIPDSACTATAYLCGVKNNDGTTGVDARVPRRDCAASMDKATHVSSIAAWALRDGRDAGVVTTTRITHASPSGVYAHIANRDWEDDSAVVDDGADPADCPDIAYQLVHDFPGNQLKVIFGGGRRHFLPEPTGQRLDGRDLIQEWQTDKSDREVTSSYVTNVSELRAVDIGSTDYILGLFDNNHMPYHLQSNEAVQPTLEELTETAIRMLSKNDKGYFLFVEGGRIDHAHHDTWPELALDETIEFSKAVTRALSLTDRDDTLVVVTSDHSHVMSINGYSARGNPILGPSRDLDEDGVPYMTLSYANGPGFRSHTSNGIRPDVTLETDFRELEWRSHVDVPLVDETHGGDDVAVFALGPQQHMFTGLYEQNQLPHLMAYAACLGADESLNAPACSAATRVAATLSALLAVNFVIARLMQLISV